jgi:hypothetical protein
MWSFIEMCIELTLIVIEKEKRACVMWLFNHPRKVAFASSA